MSKRTTPGWHDNFKQVAPVSNAQLVRETQQYLSRNPDATLFELAHELGISVQEAGDLAMAATS